MARTAFTSKVARSPWSFAWALGVALALAALAWAPTASAAVVSGAGGMRVGVQPISPTAIAPAGAQSVLMDPLDGTDQGVVYHGGPVLHGVTTYAIYWDPAGKFDPSTESLVSGFLANVAHDSGGSDNVFSVAAQYTDTTGSALYSQTYGGSFVDSDPYPPSGDCSETTATAATCLYNSQITGETERFAASHGLPTGLGSLYIVLTPDTVVTCIDDSTECSNGSYCSFHSFASDGNSTMLYIEIPFTLLDSASDAKSCQEDGNTAVQEPGGDPGFGDVAVRSLTHELLETITDPLLSAWYDTDGNEIADLCNGIAWNPDSFLPIEGGTAADGTLWNQTINGAHYYLQGAWSNATGACALTGSPIPSFAIPPTALAGTTLSFAASPGTNAPVNAYSWSFGDGQTATGQDITHAYAAAGDYTVTLTVTDSFGNAGTVSEQVDVTAPGAGKTAGASGAHSASKATTRCGKVHRGHDGAETRHCTKTVVSHSHVKSCSRAAGAARSVCHAVVRTVTRRASCTDVRSSGAAWALRCAAAVVVRENS